MGQMGVGYELISCRERHQRLCRGARPLGCGSAAPALTLIRAVSFDSHSSLDHGHADLLRAYANVKGSAQRHKPMISRDHDKWMEVVLRYFEQCLAPREINESLRVGERGPQLRLGIESDL